MITRLLVWFLNLPEWAFLAFYALVILLFVVGGLALMLAPHPPAIPGIKAK